MLEISLLLQEHFVSRIISSQDDQIFIVAQTGTQTAKVIKSSHFAQLEDICLLSTQELFVLQEKLCVSFVIVYEEG